MSRDFKPSPLLSAAFPSVIFINNYQHAISYVIMQQPSPTQAFPSISMIIYFKVKRKTALGNMMATVSLLDILHHKYQQPLQQSFYQILGLNVRDWVFHRSEKWYYKSLFLMAYYSKLPSKKNMGWSILATTNRLATAVALRHTLISD